MKKSPSFYVSCFIFIFFTSTAALMSGEDQEHDLLAVMQSFERSEVLWGKMRNMGSQDILRLQIKASEHLGKEANENTTTNNIISTLTKYPNKEMGKYLRQILLNKIDPYAEYMILFSLPEIDPSDETAEVLSAFIQKHAKNYEMANDLTIALSKTNERGKLLAKRIITDRVYPITDEGYISIQISLKETDASIAELRKKINTYTIEDDGLSVYLFKAGDIISQIIHELLEDGDRLLSKEEKSFINEVRSVMKKISISKTANKNNIEIVIEIIPIIMTLECIDEIKSLKSIRRINGHQYSEKINEILERFKN